MDFISADLIGQSTPTPLHFYGVHLIYLALLWINQLREIIKRQILQQFCKYMYQTYEQFMEYFNVKRFKDTYLIIVTSFLFEVNFP